MAFPQPDCFPLKGSILSMAFLKCSSKNIHMRESVCLIKPPLQQASISGHDTFKKNVEKLETMETIKRLESRSSKKMLKEAGLFSLKKNSQKSDLITQHKSIWRISMRRVTHQAFFRGHQTRGNRQNECRKHQGNKVKWAPQRAILGHQRTGRRENSQEWSSGGCKPSQGRSIALPTALGGALETFWKTMPEVQVLGNCITPESLPVGSHRSLWCFLKRTWAKYRQAYPHQQTSW